MTRALVWFRSDLRVEDNTALAAAAARADRGVVGVFAVTPGQWRDRHDWGVPKADFMLRAAGALSRRLAGLNIPLKVITTDWFEDLPGALLRLAEECQCDGVWFNREYELNESKRDAAVEAAFARSGRGVHAFHDQVILPPGSVLTNEGRWYTVFTPFKRKWFDTFRDGDRAGPVGAPARQRETGVAGDPVPAMLEGFAGDARPDLWPADEPHAHGRLESFIEQRIRAYHDRRDIPSVNGTSTLSPYLAAGVLSPRQCLHAAMAVNQNRVTDGARGPDGWINELVWREFYKHLVAAFPRLSRGENFNRKYDGVEWSSDTDAFRAWCEGRTGFPIVDAAMRQLARTGWMHNRLRMIVAMFLTKDLLIHWRLGERHFCRSLVDLDYASNNGGWQWAASTGTDAQPYFRIFNPASQSKKFDPDGAFIRRFVPELEGLDEKRIHEPWAKGGKGLYDDLEYPEPIVDHAEARERTLAAFKAL